VLSVSVWRFSAGFAQHFLTYVRNSLFVPLSIRSVMSLLRFVEAYLLLTGAHVALRLLPVATIGAGVGRVPGVLPPPLEPHRRDRLLTDVARAVARARRLHGVGVKCLAGALATAWSLRLRGLPASVAIGVRAAPFSAHAWTELDGRIVGDNPQHVAGFATIARF
jgi:hypothetical protein